MPTQFLNHTLGGIAQGVSQQFEEARHETQVDEMINCIPSVSRGILRRNPLQSIGSLKDTSSVALPTTGKDYYPYFFDRGTSSEQFMILIESNSGKWYVFNLSSDEAISEGTDTYLVSSEPAQDSYSLVTVQDFTFVVNKFKTPAMDAAVDGTADSHYNNGVYWIKRTTQVVTAQETDTSNNSGSLIEGYQYTLNGVTIQGVKETRPSSTAINQITGSEICEALVDGGKDTAGDTVTGLGGTYVHDGSFVYRKDLTKSSSWEWSDSLGNDSSFGFHGKVATDKNLPAKMPSALADTIVAVTGPDASPDYWLKYTDDTWKETREPGLQNTISPTNMPHVFVKDSGGTFYLKEYTETALTGISGLDATGLGWKKREVGDASSIPEPSFIDTPIQSVIFHKNRLGFITKESIILSELGEYGNFWPTTAQEVVPTDPIDITIATTDITVLRHAVATTGTLLLFSDDSQFTLKSEDGFLTPSSAVVDVATQYNYNNDAPAKVIGNMVYFTSLSGNYNQLFGYRLSEGADQITRAEHLSSHIPSYLGQNLQRIIGHSNLGYIFMLQQSGTSNEMFVYNIKEVGGSIIQSAFHKWSFANNILSGNVVGNELYLLFSDMSLGKITLEFPADIDSIVYSDNATTDYTSLIRFSKWYIKDDNGNGTRRGRLQIGSIKYTIDDNSHYTTTLYNEALAQGVDDALSILLEGVWVDSALWDDTQIWIDALPYYKRVYKDDDKVTVTSNSDTTVIEFSSNEDYPTKGFGLNTVNYEGIFHMRSNRY